MRERNFLAGLERRNVYKVAVVRNGLRTLDGCNDSI